MHASICILKAQKEALEMIVKMQKRKVFFFHRRLLIHDAPEEGSDVF